MDPVARKSAESANDDPPHAGPLIYMHIYLAAKNVNKVEPSLVHKDSKLAFGKHFLVDIGHRSSGFGR
jgi:hypothetical protein